MPRKNDQAYLLPTTAEECRRLGWQRPDVVIVTGDAYIDTPAIGACLIGRVLQKSGYRVGIIAQPDVNTGRDISRLGEPLLFWGVTGGSIDSMVANYTALGKPRRSDDLTPGGRNTRRPDRAVIVYSNLIRRYFKNTVPIVLGGIEASLRRVSHYDAWSDKIRRSILFDAKADILAYGMAEQTVLEMAHNLRQKKPIHAVRGICYISRHAPQPSAAFPQPALELPPHAVVAADKQQFTEMFSTFYRNIHWRTARRLYQRQDTRYLVHNPPQPPLSTSQLDAVYELDYSRDVHPYYAGQGDVFALATIRFSLSSHRGCYGECRFCAIALHQGTQVVSRSQDSLLREAASFRSHPDFKGIISDVGGPTANMYAIECKKKVRKGPCSRKSCLFPKPCPELAIDHRPQITLLQSLRSLDGIRKVFVASGLRTDMILADQAHGASYLENLMRHHVSGQLKIAPEHVQESVLSVMGKPGQKQLEDFISLFESLRQRHAFTVFLTYYLMAAHPGCTLEDMQALGRYADARFRMRPEQVQIFTPTPSTVSTLMYYTGIDPFSGGSVFVEKSVAGKQRQKQAILKPKITSPSPKRIRVHGNLDNPIKNRRKNRQCRR